MLIFFIHAFLVKNNMKKNKATLILPGTQAGQPTGIIQIQTSKY